ncbi:hypothetical protein AXE80_01145 [Wenyingzhuangia fucanilytica]|uniref:non-specific protein-tyrosine kinase n=1 Tax=Wenyingzhuangia fucanilytica TaxID=1790137 RepID=A0A1B1Y2I7_9FLAO|nr:tyrosine-protein kinase [Wenyingzhuangia fucanilytica]ANW94981.1 hypothetical protein AXE80_01145 [Wenyingzhuangia fucanilytica]
MENNIENIYNKENDSINIRAEVEKYLIHWKWFVISVIVCVTIAVFYAKSQVNIFKTNATVLVKEEGSAASELQVFQDLASLGAGAKNNVIDEIEILKSRTLAEAYVRALNLNFAVYQQQGLKKVEQFEVTPINYQVLSDQNNFYELDTIIDITILNDQQFEYQVEGQDELKSAKFGEKIKIDQYEFLFIPEFKKFEENRNNSYEVVFTKLAASIEKFKNKISVSPVDDSNIITVSLQYPIKTKAQLVLNTMIDLYNQMSVEDKNQVGKKTDTFIEERLAGIKRELDEVDQLEEVYKKDKQITDIEVQARVFVDGKSLNDQEILKRTTALSVVNYMISSIDDQKEDFELLPTSIGIEDNIQLSASVANYNQLLLNRNKYPKENPIVQNLNVELANLRENIKRSLKNNKKQLEIGLASLKEKEKEFEGEISSMPQKIREYRTILRRQEIIAQLYSYLLQKKEENKISMAVTVPNAKIIDRAYSDKNAVAPKKAMIALAGLIIGIIIPFGVIYIRELLDTKFHSRAELEKYVSTPILGDIPFDKSEEKVIIKQGSRTSSAEAFRLLRTNLDFILSGVTDKSKVIFVTSTISGEGKTFISVNSASSIALTGKKVLLVGMDLRAPKITQYLGLPNRSGVSNYLIGQEDKITDLVFPLQGFENLDVLSSGIVPPNPAELLLSARLQKMFEELREQYDYIIVDTAPVNLVTDTLMMSKHADMFVYVARANYLDKRMLEMSQKLYQEKRLPNMAMLINGMDHERVYGYGVYGYGGYGYPDEEEDKSFIKKIFRL